jgi:hypothetical protein
LLLGTDLAAAFGTDPFTNLVTTQLPVAAAPWRIIAD